MKKLTIEFMPREKQGSKYDWANINADEKMVGKARCRLSNNEMIIYSIDIFPEFERKGYGTAFIEEGKKKYNILVADRVRHKADGFWEKMGFKPDDSGNWVFKKNSL